MSKYAANGHYVLTELVLEHDQGELNLFPVMVSMNIYESIVDGMMSGDLSIIDSVNMAELIPLYGNEKLRIGYHTAGNDQNPIEFTGLLYKIAPKHRITEHSTGYTMHFCSPASLNSERTFVQRGMKGTADQIVSTIYTDFLAGEGDTKPIVTSPSKGNMQYAFGALTPMECISIVSQKAVSGAGDHSYVFFENVHEFVYKPLQELYAQEPAASYSYQSAGVYIDVENRNEEQFESIQAIEMFDENSLVDRVMDGLHGSLHYHFDLMTKEYLDGADVRYSKAEWYDRSKSLGEKPDLHPIEPSNDVVYLTYGASEESKLMHHDAIDSRMKRREAVMFKANITVFGDSKIRCGDVVEVFIPNLNIDQENIKSAYSGRVLIGAVRHAFTQSQYLQTFLIQKDAYMEIDT